jgi:hypothetical protein
MFLNKCSIDERMWCTRIKKNNYGVIWNTKHTHHDGFSLRNCSSLRVEHTPSFLISLSLLGILVVAFVLVLVLLLSCRIFLKVRVILLRIWALPREVCQLPIIVVGIVIVVALWGWGMKARGIRQSWLCKSCSWSDKWLLPSLELWWMIWITGMVNRVINNFLALLVATRKLEGHILLLTLLCLWYSSSEAMAILTASWQVALGQVIIIIWILEFRPLIPRLEFWGAWGGCVPAGAPNSKPWRSKGWMGRHP